MTAASKANRAYAAELRRIEAGGEIDLSDFFEDSEEFARAREAAMLAPSSVCLHGTLRIVCEVCS